MSAKRPGPFPFDIGQDADIALAEPECVSMQSENRQAANAETPVPLPRKSSKPYARSGHTLQVVQQKPAESSVFEAKTPYRQFDCDNYERCLGLAAALDWGSFTCTNCSGVINDRLLWRAHHILKQDDDMATLCELPLLNGNGKTTRDCASSPAEIKPVVVLDLSASRSRK